MKYLISVTVLVCHLTSISTDPGIVEVSPEFKRTREKGTPSPRPFSYNLITDDFKTTTPSTASSLQSFKITAEDVVTGTNAVYGSSANLQDGGIIFAFSQGQGSTSQPLMSAAPPQPVLMQFLSPEGTPKQTAVQYIQLLRPFQMMVPSAQYLPGNSNPTYDTEAKTSILDSPTPRPLSSFSPFESYSRQPFVGSYSSPQSSYFQMDSQLLRDEVKPADSDLALNLNEYIPSASSPRTSVPQRAASSFHHVFAAPPASPHYASASSHHLSSVLAPKNSMFSPMLPFAYKPNSYKHVAQRA